MNGTPAPPDEAALVQGLRAGDPATFETLIRTYGGRLTQVARRILFNEEDAREVVQEAFISAFKAREQFSGDAKLSTWLHRITVNAALMKLRSKRRRPEEPIEDLVPRFLPNGRHTEVFRSWDEPVDVALERKETAQFVRDAIDRLPEAYRTVLILRDLQGLTGPETAEVLDTTVNAVKIRLHRARMALRTLLAPQMEGAAS
ncbi:MAG: sigma-70 family RNA polymerase sigma factor [Vicinamibacterales bacterium]